MRIASQNSGDVSVQPSFSKVNSPSVDTPKVQKTTAEPVEKQAKPLLNETSSQDLKATEDKIDEAISSLNELLDLNHKSSKFVKHEGLDKYYVRLVDSETEEVIKEIPPERLLDAFYEMQKLVGMIVDEKI